MDARRYRLLGGLDVLDGPALLDLGTRKQRAVLAVLLLADGHVVSTDRLIDAVWGDDPPDRAEASLQSYVSTLRRTLEPDRAPRAPATVLVTRGPGYALLTDRGAVDARRFTDLVEQGRSLHAAGDLPAAATALRNALAMYAPLLPEFEGEDFRQEAARHLDGVHESALELSYEVRLELGEHRRLLTDLQAAVQRHPLNEGLWALLAVARYRSGRQADALRAVADCRRVLAEEIGVDPGPRLRQLEADLLAQAPHLDAETAFRSRNGLPRATVLTPSAGPADGGTGPEATTDAGSVTGREDRPAAAPEGRSSSLPRPAHPLVGRADELTLLTQVIEDCADGGHGLVVVEGEPGGGKTRLLEEASLVAARRGTLVMWGRCLEGEGTPTMWPWVQAVGGLLDGLDAGVREEWLSGELGRLLEPRDDGRPAATVLPDAGARFRMFEQAAHVVEQVAALRPVLLVIDDLQWADSTSLQLFEHLAARLVRRTMMIGSLRDRAPAPGSELARMLATASRLPGHRRIRLGPLAADDVAELVRQETGQAPGHRAAASIRSRAGGNPFFVRELARLLKDNGDVGDGRAEGVPSGVRDVVRGRMAGLDDAAKNLLQLAALVGREVNLGLLARAAGLDVERCLELLEPVEALGLMTPTPDDPFSFRFAHDLIRESVTEVTPPLRATRLHLKVADALEATSAEPSAVAERLAHHLWSAGPLAAPTRTAAALIAAGRRAIAKYGHADAERHLEGAAGLARSAGDAALEVEALQLLIVVAGMRVGYVGATLAHLERAEELARQLGRERLAADFLYSRWAAHSQGVRLDQSGPLAARLLEQGQASDDPVLRLYGEHAWGVHQWDLGNVGAALRSLTGPYRIHRERQDLHDDEALLRFDLQLLVPVFFAHVTGLHGDSEGSYALFEEMERDLAGDPYPTTVWGAFHSITASLAGDAARALRVTERSIAADPEFTFEFLGTYQRISQWWARAVIGDDPSTAADRMGALLGHMPVDPPRSGVATWTTLYAEALLAAGRTDEAGAALDHAERHLETYGQRYCEGLTLLLRAKWLHARGTDGATVRAMLDRARDLAAEREAFLFVRRCDDFAAELGG